MVCATQYIVRVYRTVYSAWWPLVVRRPGVDVLVWMWCAARPVVVAALSNAEQLADQISCRPKKQITGSYWLSWQLARWLKFKV
jgi:hypothetical protein